MSGQYISDINKTSIQKYTSQGLHGMKTAVVVVLGWRISSLTPQDVF